MCDLAILISAIQSTSFSFVGASCFCYILVGILVAASSGKDNSFGWQKANEPTIPEHSWRKAPECNIDTLDEVAWQDRFLQDYYLRKPVILVGWNATAIQMLQRKTDRRTLLRSFGDLHVQVGSFYDLVSKGKADSMVAFRQYLSELWGAQYLFEDAEFPERIGVNGIWTQPPELDATGLFQHNPLILAMGANGQGIPFHWHEDSYSVLLHGEKRWAIYAPGNMTPTGFLSRESFVTWLMTRQNDSNFVPPQWECVQRPGDVLYVPEGFFHATACIGDAVGLTKLADRPSDSTAFGKYREASSYITERKALQVAKIALKLDPTNAEIWMFLADKYGGSGNVKKAVMACRKALQRNPLSIDAHHALLFGLEQMGDRDGMRRHQAHMVKLGIEAGNSVQGMEIEVDLGNIPTGRAAEL